MPSPGVLLKKGLAAYGITTAQLQDEAAALDSEQEVGGASLLLSATVTLTNAQIKALNATPVGIVAAPGAGKAILVVRALIAAHIPTTGYSWTDPSSSGSNPYLFLATSGGSASNPVATEDLGQLFQAADDNYRHLQGGVGAATSSSPISASNQVYENAALTVVLDTDFDVKVGDPENTLKVTVYYVEVTL